MTVKMLSDKRGPLQGVSIEAIVRNAYGPDARYVKDDADGQLAGVIVNEDEGGEPLDTIIELHED